MRLHNILLALLLALFSVLGCSCDLITSDNTPKLIWTASLSSGELIEGIFMGIFHTESNGVLFLGSKQGKPILYFVNAESGKILWQWQDFFSLSEYVDNRYPYIISN